MTALFAGGDRPELTPRTVLVHYLHAVAAQAGLSVRLVLGAGPVAGADVLPDEAGVLRAFVEHVRTADPDVLTGWNVCDFDLVVLLAGICIGVAALSGVVKAVTGFGFGWWGVAIAAAILSNCTRMVAVQALASAVPASAWRRRLIISV